MLDRSYRLPYEKRAEARNDVQRRAIEQIFTIWKSGIRSAVLVRPTGFGKTYTVASLLNMDNKARTAKIFRKVLFVYPMTVVADSLKDDIAKINRSNRRLGRLTIDDSPNKIVYLSYHMLSRIQKYGQDYFDKEYSDFDLIIFDEFHCSGAEKTVIGCKKLYLATKHARLLGMTATYNRNDGVDQAFEIFGERNMTEIYTYTDAVNDGIMPKFAYYDGKWYGYVDEHGKPIIDTNSTDDSDIIARDRTKVADVIKNTICNFGEVIRNAVVDVLGDDGVNRAQRWLCLFASVDDLNMKKQEVLVSFEDAFPDKEIKLVPIHSREREAQAGIKKLHEAFGEDGEPLPNEYLHPNDNQCVVIMAVNMLNMGYHAGEFTGEVLYRVTQSNIIYQQQLGRTVDAMREYEPIIIDLVGAFDKLRIDAPLIVSKGGTGNTKKPGDANALTRECLEFRAVPKKFSDIATKIDHFQAAKVYEMLIDCIFRGVITTPKQINDFAREYRLNPKYMYSVVKDVVKKGEATIIKTHIGTLGGVTKLEKRKETIVVTPEQEAEIDKMFGGLI